MFFCTVLAFFLASSIFQLQLAFSLIFNVSHSDFSLYEYSITSKSCDTSRFLDRSYFNNNDQGKIHRVSVSTINKVSEESDGQMECWEYNLDRNSLKLKLLRFKVQHVVRCLDELFMRKNRSVSISFIGDSLVRNQFSNFIKVSNIIILLMYNWI